MSGYRIEDFNEDFIEFYEAIRSHTSILFQRQLSGFADDDLASAVSKEDIHRRIMEEEVEFFESKARQISDKALLIGDNVRGRAWAAVAETYSSLAESTVATHDRYSTASMEQLTRRTAGTAAGGALALGAFFLDVNDITQSENSYQIGKQAFSILTGAIGAAIGGLFLIGVTGVFGPAIWLIASASLGSQIGSLLWDGVFGIDGAMPDFFGDAQTWEPRRDPLILDLDGDGIETVGANGYDGVLFDHTGDGVAQASGWVSRDDGLLVLDRDGNGTIDSGRELFGDNTELASGGTARDGFEALRDLDDNQDGVVDAADAAYSDLRVWRDSNMDGVSQAGELQALDELDIAALNTDSSDTDESLGNGNVLTDAGTYIRGDGSSQNMGDVDFASNPFYREFQSIVEITDRAAGLPEVRGSGMVRDLREAASLSEPLAAILETYALASTRAEQNQLLDQLLSEWARTSSMPTYSREALAAGIMVDYRFGDVSIDASLIPSGVISIAEGDDVVDTVWAEFNASQGPEYNRWLGRLGVLERFVGTGFDEFAADLAGEHGSYEFSVEDPSGDIRAETFARHSVDLSNEQVGLLSSSYASLRGSVYQSLLPQTRLRPYLESISLTIENDEVGLDFTATESLFLDRIAADSENGLIDLLEFNNGLGQELATYGWGGWELFTEHLQDLELGAGALAVLDEFAVSPISPEQPELSGSAGAEVLIGSARADRLNGLGGDDHLVGGGGQDLLDGGWGHDTLVGGEGNDELHGFDGADIYRFHRNHGRDIINERWSGSQSDVIEFGGGIGPSDIRVLRSGQNLVLENQNGRDRISVSEWYTDPTRRIERVLFADGTEWSGGELHAWGLETHGSTGDDEIRGAEGNHADRLFGEAGDDFLAGGLGADVLNGGEGSDTLSGDFGDDILRGGSGDDQLWGDDGSDIYALELGDGNDTIRENSRGGSDTDRVVFGEGITERDLWFSRADADLSIRNLQSDDTLTIEGWYRHSRHRVERFELEQGGILLAGHVSQLVNAMAAYDPAPGHETSPPDESRALLEPLITASWQPAG